VTNPAAGRFCVTVPGVSSADGVAVVTADYSNSVKTPGTNASQAHVEVSPGSCPAPVFGVKTFVRTFPDASPTALTATNQGVFILVP
jgi:hypothetical protein